MLPLAAITAELPEHLLSACNVESIERQASIQF